MICSWCFILVFFILFFHFTIWRSSFWLKDSQTAFLQAYSFLFLCAQFRSLWPNTSFIQFIPQRYSVCLRLLEKARKSWVPMTASSSSSSAYRYSHNQSKWAIEATDLKRKRNKEKISHQHCSKLVNKITFGFLPCEWQNQSTFKNTIWQKKVT